MTTLDVWCVRQCQALSRWCAPCGTLRCVLPVTGRPADEGYPNLWVPPGINLAKPRPLSMVLC